jgi:PAS domain S-box-containing protein
VQHLLREISKLFLTPRQRAEEERHAYELWDLYENAPIAYFSVDASGIVGRCNRAACALTGYSAAELLGRDALDLFADTFHGKPKAHRMLDRFKHGKAIQGQELEMVRADGSVRWVSLSVSTIRDQSGRPAEGRSMVEDITERKLAALELERKTWELSERVKELNGLYRFAQLVEGPGASLEDIYQGLVDLIPDSWQYPGITCAGISTPEGLFSTDDFEDTPWQMHTSVRVHGQPHGVLTVGYLEKRPQADEGPFLAGERALLDALAERLGRVVERIEAEAARWEAEQKQSLMDELNHRVKNNLNLVASLISLKDGALGEAADLSDIRNQVDAISRIHQKLYETGDVTHVDFGRYVRETLQSVFSFYSAASVRLDIAVEDLVLPTKTAVSLGLIINELATNAVKYGFTDGTEPVFSVSCVEAAPEGDNLCYALRISNSGRPFPDEIDLDNPATLGLRLITALCEQLGGTIELERRPQPVFTLRFCARE